MVRAALLAGVVVLCSGAPVWGQDARRDEQPAPPPKAPPKLTKQPVLLQQAAPEYPKEAAAKGLQADVKVRLFIDAEGTVEKVEVLTPAGNGFDEAAVAAAEQYLFEPAEWDGVPGKIQVETTIHFVLEKREEPEVPPDKPPGETPVDTGPPSHGGDMKRPVAIEGDAVERGSRRKLSGIIVSVAELGMDAVTDESGHFWFHGVPPGTYKILAVDDRYDRFERTLEVKKSERVEVRLWMRARGGSPYETVVEGEREILEVTRRTLERRQLTNVPGTFGDPIRVIQTLPGLARTPFATGFLVIRGSNPDDSGVFIDGHRVPLLFHFLGGPSFLNPEFLEKLDLYPGGFPARFGRAHGGIVAIETRSAKSDGIHGSGDVDLLDSSGYIRFPVGKHGAFAIAGRRSYLDFMLGFFLPEPDPGDTLIVVPVYYDYQLRYDHDLGRHGKATVFVVGSTDTLDVLSVDAEDEQSLDLSTAVKFSRVIGTYRRPFVDDLALTLSWAYGRDSVGFGSSQQDAGTPFTSFNADVDVLSYRMRVDGKLRSNLVLDTGLDMESRVTHYRALLPVADDVATPQNIDIDPELLETSADQLAIGLYADLAWNPIPRLRLIPGLRLDGYLLNALERWSLDPRLVGRYQIDKQWTAKGYVGKYSQPPQPEALDRRFGNPALTMEHGIHVGAGAEWQPRRLYTIDGEVYWVKRSNQVAFTDQVDIDPDTGAVTPLYWLNSRSGDTVGFELLAKREVTRNLYGWLSYTLSWSRTRREEDDRWVPTGLDQRHTLNAVASYKTDGGWEFGARFRLATGSPETPVVGSTYDADDNDYDPVEGPFRSGRRKAFHQLDARIDKTWTFNTWLLGLYLDVQNVLNVENVEATEWDYRYRESAPVTSVPFLPTIGIRGQW
jgi:TonB family protein